MLKFVNLGSGSKGNASIVFNESNMILIDAGLSAAQIRKRMALLALDIDDVEAVLITHEHGDHVNGCKRLFERQQKLQFFINPISYRALPQAFPEPRHFEPRVHFFNAGDRFQVGSLQVQCVPTLHDSQSSTGFVVQNEKVSLGYMTDLGAVTEDNFLALKDVSFLLMEANYDHDMLWNGPYPAFLKARVHGNYGHLSNDHSSEFIRLLATLGRLRRVMLGHLSEKNNLPEKARATVENRQDVPLELEIASQYEPSPIIEVE
ncbi:MAG: MBL fold metallo-hydrolase [Lentisphaeria bacterium]|nr:MBL fold metallo-hydrolase [Candidatus Neomarinimicrobiota bacterium]MCF7841503.1 MBL fold metallo-hydrolase [Lentisphaeria bacterium]